MDEEDEIPVLDQIADDSSDDSDDDDVHSNINAETTEVPIVTYDTSITSNHSYLGTLDDVRGRTVLDDDCRVSLPLLSLPGIVLVPGQTLPLNLFRPAIVAMMQTVVAGNKTFGLVTTRYDGEDSIPTPSRTGTTAEVLAVKEDRDEHSAITTMQVKAIGRQRFEVDKTHRQIDGILMAKVRILPERVLCDSLEGARPMSQLRWCACQHALTAPPAVDLTADVGRVLQTWLTSNRKRKVDHLLCAVATAWPSWVYRQYDVYYIMKKVQDELKSWNSSIDLDVVPKDPTEFSFWVAGNLPLDDAMKLQLLQVDSAIQRLRCELSLMQKCTVLCCSNCNVLIANKRDMFSMSAGGMLAAFVNPHGQVHETLTVYTALNLTLHGRPSTEYSWFPGFAWTIAQCRNCSSHMGWKFTAAKKHLKPDKFWGLCRSSLVPGLKRETPTESQGISTLEDWTPVM